jgi:hypothetical protein
MTANEAVTKPNKPKEMRRCSVHPESKVIGLMAVVMALEA